MQQNNSLNLPVEKIWSTNLYQARYAQNDSFHSLECHFERNLDLTTVSQNDRFFLQRFVDATDVQSSISAILQHPFSQRIGLECSVSMDGTKQKVTYLLPKAQQIHNKLGALKTGYRLVEHKGAHIDPSEYVTYIARGVFPLSAEPSWHMIHDRLDHVIGAVSVTKSELAQQKEFALKTLSLDVQSEEYKTRCLVLTDMLDAFTYDTTLSFVSEKLPTEKTYRELVVEFDKKQTAYKSSFSELGIDAATFIEQLATSLKHARALL